MAQSSSDLNVDQIISNLLEYRNDKKDKTSKLTEEQIIGLCHVARQIFLNQVLIQQKLKLSQMWNMEKSLLFYS